MQLSKYQERFDSLTSREKIFVVVTLAVALWSAWDKIIFQPLTLKKQTLNQEFTSLQSQIRSQKEAENLLGKEVFVDPDTDKRAQLAALKEQYDRLQDQIMHGNKKFVPPKAMAKALSDMLRQNNQLKLVKLTTVPPTPLLEAKHPNKPIYKHGLVLTFSATYLDTVSYLEALEELPWAFLWGSLDYQVKDYPLAEVTIQIFTLSFEKEWLGV